MANAGDQKLKLMYLLKILKENTDETHGITMQEIIQQLDRYGIRAERKALYTDFDSLARLGYEIEREKSDKYYYKLLTRDLDLTELKILVDAVQASKFLTQKRAENLIRKLEDQTSRYHRKDLQRQVYVVDRVSSRNEEVFDSIDCIHRAISENRKIRFQYRKWSERKKFEFTGKNYLISPWYLCWNDENYYLIAYDTEAGKIKHYRVDRMSKPLITEEKRDGAEQLEHISLPEYTRKLFGMYGGEEKRITIRIPSELSGVMIDRFGENLSIRPDNEQENYAIVHIQVAFSQQFIGWLLGLGPEVEVISPSEVREVLCERGRELTEKYRM